MLAPFLGGLSPDIGGLSKEVAMQTYYSRSFFALQIAFAQRVSERFGLSLGDALWQCTSFARESIVLDIRTPGDMMRRHCMAQRMHRGMMNITFDKIFVDHIFDRSCCHLRLELRDEETLVLDLRANLQIRRQRLTRFFSSVE